MSSPHRIAYLSGGNLFLSKDGSPFLPIESTFISAMKSRLQGIQKRNEWKTTGEGARFMGVQPSSGGVDPEGLIARFTGLSLWGNGCIRYSLQSDSVGGLFDYRYCEKEEQRLIHKEYFNISDIDVNDRKETICSAASPSGVTNIALISGNDISQLTEGDSFDEVPRWIPGSKNAVVFHSAGIARSGDGVFSGVGNFCIMRMDMTAGTLDTILENSSYDFLSPCFSETGNLYCIRRRYENRTHGVSFLSSMKDMVWFPVRLMQTIVGYLNFLSLVYSKKPLITAGGNGRKGPDPKSVFLYGRMIDVDKQMKKAKPEDGGIMPSDWELVKVTASGQMNIVAKGVSAFDLCGDEIVYTNGTRVFHLSSEGVKSCIAEGNCIEKLRWCSAGMEG
jgi:hypothetical protein